MTVTQPHCPHCGAPIARQESGLVYCPYCATPLVWSRDGFQTSASYVDDNLIDPERPRFWLEGHRYRLLGRLAQGESSDVFLALRDHRLTERVVVKCLRAHEDRDLWEQEWETLRTLQQSSARGSEHFTRLLPQPVASGEGRLGVRGREGRRLFTICGFASGFVHSFLDIADHYKDGVPPAAGVWLWKRILELTSFIHSSGFVHGAITPRHLLVHARDHGVRLCGFSSAVKIGEKLRAFPNDDFDFCSEGAKGGGAVGPAHDICASARSVLSVMGGSPKKAPGSAPDALAKLLERAAGPEAGGYQDAWAVRDELDSVAASVFGDAKFIPFPMPGWAFAGAK